MQRMISVKRWIPFVSLVAIIALVTYYQFFFHQTVKLAEYPIARTIKYSFTVNNPNSYAVNNSELLTYLPIGKSAFQHLEKVTANLPYKKEFDQQGNERMVFTLETLPPYATKTISVTVNIKLSEMDNKIDRFHSETYLNDEELIGLNNPHIQNVARNLKADTPKETIGKIYNWITKNIKKSGYVKKDLGAQYALTNKTGDCTEFMYLFSALARANGIPTRNMAGFVASENKVLRPADYHNWNEVYIDGEWYLVDADKQVLMKKSSEYIAMRLIGESTSDQFANSQNFFSSSSDIQVSMN